LIELLFVVIIVLVITSIAAPQIADLRGGMAARGARDDFLSAHNLAKAMAVRSNRVAQLRIRTDTAMFWVQVDTTLAGSGSMDTIGTVFRLADANVVIQSDRSVLCFDARGIASSVPPCDATQSALVVFTHENDADTVRRTVAGIIPR
jgi:Tfp pilus assembly protein FimT